ncbi:hypothetical protein MOQ_008264, partial [Trypanosoma cruzi marinkellei]
MHARTEAAMCKRGMAQLPQTSKMLKKYKTFFGLFFNFRNYLKTEIKRKKIGETGWGTPFPPRTDEPLLLLRRLRLTLACRTLVARLLLLLAVEGVEADVRHLHDLETHSGNIADGVAGTTESRHQNLVILLDEVQAAVIGHEGNDLLVVFDQLHTNALTNGRVRLLRTNADLLQHDALRVGGAAKRVGLLRHESVGLLPALVGPAVLATQA